MATVLVVDDSLLTRSLARLTLERMGHEVLEAPDGPEGLCSALRSEPDVILAGTVLPCFGAETLLRRLRETGRAPAALLVGAEPGASPSERHTALGVGALLSRPLEASSLRAAMERIGASAAA